MFRITKIFDDSSLTIYRIEGKIGDESLQIWTDELHALPKPPGHKLILDFCHVWSIDGKAVEILMTSLSNDFQVMNPSMEIRNRLHAAGLSDRVLA